MCITKSINLKNAKMTYNLGQRELIKQNNTMHQVKTETIRPKEKKENWPTTL
jgi:hypothetical protein